jgi:hypothetical protein
LHIGYLIYNKRSIEWNESYSYFRCV